MEQGRSPGFAIAVLEAVGKAADDVGAAPALRRIAGKVPDWADIAQQALARIGASGRAASAGQAQSVASSAGDGSMATGTPPPAAGPVHRSQPRRVCVPQPRPPPGRGGLGLHHALEGRDPPGRARVTVGALATVGGVVLDRHRLGEADPVLAQVGRCLPGVPGLVHPGERSDGRSPDAHLGLTRGLTGNLSQRASMIGRE